MDKIASPRDLQAALQRLIDACSSGKPSRDVLAYELRRLAAKVANEPDPVEDAKKHGEWNLIIRKNRSRYQYFMENPQGGGGGSGSYPSMKAAIDAGLRVDWKKHGKGKTKVWLIQAEWSPMDENYVVKKAGWLDIPKELLEYEAKPLTEQERWEMFTR